jgi:hypothetical protein
MLVYRVYHKCCNLAALDAHHLQWVGEGAAALVLEGLGCVCNGAFLC